MSLPTLAVQTHSCTLPDSGKEVSYRPFIVREEKILMLAASGEDKDKFSDIFKQIVEVLRACTFDKIRVDKLSSIDFEFLFLRIKIASKGGIESQVYKCKREVTTSDVTEPTEICNSELSLDIDFEEIKLNGEMPSNKIVIDKDLTICLNIPTLDIISKLQEVELDEIELLACCLQSVLYKGEMSTEFDLGEAETFIESMNEIQLKPLVKFFKDVPRLTYKTKVKCNKCSHVHNFEIEGLENFFG